MSESDNQDDFLRGFENIPSDKKLQSFSYIQLLAERHSTKRDSPRFHVITREINKHILNYQSKLNRKNIIIGALIGGVFGLSGVALGYFLK